jgi:phage-related minor tail protein
MTDDLKQTISKQDARIKKLTDALEGMLAEWDKFTRYGSPIAKAANERVAFARTVLSEQPK